VLVTGGGLVTLVESLVLLRLPYFYVRMHGPSMGTTIGTATVPRGKIWRSVAFSMNLPKYNAYVTLPAFCVAEGQVRYHPETFLRSMAPLGHIMLHITRFKSLGR
jgi:hypothetical protein